MDIFILLATMLVCFLIGMPIAYSLAMAAIAGAWSIGIPLEAVMLKISDGVSKVAMLTIPFFVLAGAIMAEGGMARRLVAFADVLVGFTRAARRPFHRQRAGHHLPERHLRLGGRRHLRDRLGDDPANGKDRLSARVRHQSHHHLLGSGAAGAAEPQCGAVFAGDRRHDFDQRAVHGRRVSGPAARLLADRSLSRHSPTATGTRMARPCRRRTRSGSRSMPPGDW